MLGFPHLKCRTAWRNCRRFTLLMLGFALCGCLSVAPQATTAAPEDLMTGTYGQVAWQNGDPAQRAWIYAYRSAAGNFRGPADYAARSEEDGSYLLDLPPGKWFLVARYRDQRATDGPPKNGDAWAIAAENPVSLREEQTRRVDFSLRQVSQPMLLRGNSLSSGDTGFRGRLVDDKGRPVPGALALAYRDLDFQRMPDLTSAAVAADGRFVLYLPDAGRYCLAARQKTRGQPTRGELYGLLGDGENPCRQARQGEIVDVGDIHLTPYLR